jgi:hypothetical protein
MSVEDLFAAVVEEIDSVPLPVMPEVEALIQAVGR